MHRDFSRREFLLWSGGLIGASLLPACARAPLFGSVKNSFGAYGAETCPDFVHAGMGSLVMPSLRSPRESFGAAYAEKSNVLSRIDFSTRRASWVETPLHLTHSALRLPRTQPGVIVFEKDGANACVIDLEQMGVERVVQAKPGWFFNGHGVFSRDGAVLYDTEYSLENKDISAVVVRDGRSFEIIGELDSHGIQAHDLTLIRGGTQLVVGHYGRLPQEKPAELGATVTVLELPSGKLLESIPAQNGNHELCHIAATEEGRLLVSVQNFTRISSGENKSIKEQDLRLSTLRHQQKHFSAPVMIGQIGAGSSSWKNILPKGMEKEFTYNFSTVVLEERQIAAVAHISGAYVSFWDLKAGRFLGGQAMKAGASGLTLSKDRRHFIASTGPELHFFPVDTLKLAGSMRLGANVAAPHILTI